MVISLGCSEKTGGISPTYPARDYDPKLTGYANLLLPVIHALNSHIQDNGRAPTSLEQLEAIVSFPPNLYYIPESYMSESESYRVGIQLGWDPILWYESNSRKWIFDPGDGTSEKSIKLKPTHP